MIAETKTGNAGTEAKVEELADSTAQNRKYRITIPRGADGRDGKTPIKGQDYWTEEDKTTMVDDTIEEIKNRGLISGNNGNLAMAYAETVVNADGTTTLKIIDDVNL